VCKLRKVPKEALNFDIHKVYEGIFGGTNNKGQEIILGQAAEYSVNVASGERKLVKTYDVEVSFQMNEIADINFEKINLTSKGLEMLGDEED